MNTNSQKIDELFTLWESLDNNSNSSAIDDDLIDDIARLMHKISLKMRSYIGSDSSAGDIVKLIFAETNYGASELHDHFYSHLKSLQLKKCA